MTEPAGELRAHFGEIDIYLFDQLHRGKLVHGMRVLDAGCGAGRNLVFLLRSGFDVSGVDESEDAIAETRRMAAALAPQLEPERFRREPVERMSFDSGSMDYVISSAVLHFAPDRAQWTAMLEEMWRVLAPGGILFARLASTVGQDGKLTPIGGGRYVMPDGHERFLVDETMLLDETRRLGGELIDPIKTTVVYNQRSMTTWVVRKRD